MGSPLLYNDRVSFVVTKPFTSGEKEYAVGDDFPQEDARNIEVLVRARYVAPVVEDLADRPKYWYKEVRLKSDVLARLNREHVQVRMPEPYAEHDENQVDLQVLTHPATTPEPEDREVGEDEEAPPAEAVHLDQYDPSYHSVREVNAHLAQIHDPEEKERVLEAERSGKARKGILES